MADSITVIHTTEHLSIREAAAELFETVELHRQIDFGMRICIKPNLVVAREATQGATTHPELAEALLGYLFDHGARDLVIAEGSWVGERTSRAFDACGYSELARRYPIELIDTQTERSSVRKKDGYRIEVCDLFDSVDLLINLPVVKGHCQTGYTGALKNLKGCIPDREKRRFHSLGLHEPIARLNTLLKQDLIIADGICGDPTFEEGGDPSEMNRLFFCTDPVLFDSYACTLLGFRPDEIEYIRKSAAYGCGRLFDPSVTIREINRPEYDQRVEREDSALLEAKGKIDARSACSSCYANLVSAIRSSRSEESFFIGRDFRDKELLSLTGLQGCIGVGDCTRGAERQITGCPPSVDSILGYLCTDQKSSGSAATDSGRGSEA